MSANCDGCREAQRDIDRAQALLTRLKLEAGEPLAIAALQNRLERLVSYLLRHQMEHEPAS